jgi:hypothetical protein
MKITIANSSKFEVHTPIEKLVRVFIIKENGENGGKFDKVLKI